MKRKLTKTGRISREVRRPGSVSFFSGSDWELLRFGISAGSVWPQACPMWVWNSNRKWWLCQCTTESKGKGPWKMEQQEGGENFCTCHEGVPSTARHTSFRRLTCHCHSIHTLNSYAHTLFQHVGEGRLIDSYHMPGKETQRRASFLSSKLRAPLVRQVQPWETNWNSARGDLARTELLLGRGEQLIVWVIGSPGRKCESHRPWKRHAAFWKLFFWSCL